MFLLSNCGHQSNCDSDNGVGGFGGGFAFIVVLFILLIIVGATCYGSGNGVVQGYGGFC
ncbi:YjcZ family sporulation protein [Peribacillus frigoritolerans]|uniref:YjcZ family sporulation protein n=1 Tax=Peribacillus frigoritolerans TaxID=450367 RepID=UPI002ED16AA2|nr:YjcZ family sporulation protein [Peribacillus frigoritolerans]